MTSHPRAGAEPENYATTTRLADGRHELRYERRLRHPVARVWAALTEPAELIGWLGAGTR